MKRLSSVIIRYLFVSSVAGLIILFVVSNIYFRHTLNALARARLRENLPKIAQDIKMMMDRRPPPAEGEDNQRPDFRHMPFFVRIYGQDGTIINEFPKRINDEKITKINDRPVPLPDSPYTMDVFTRDKTFLNDGEQAMLKLFIVYSFVLCGLLMIAYVLIARLVSRKIVAFFNRERQKLVAIASGNYSMRVDAEYEEFMVFKESIDAMTLRLRNEEERKREFIVNFSHDIRTPLTVVRGTIEGIGDGLVPVNEKNLSGILREIHRIEEMTSAVKNFDRTHFSKHERFDLAAIARHVSEKYSMMQITVTGEAEDYPCDKAEIERIFDNLLSNALKYNSKDEKRCAITISKNTSSVTVKLRDNGNGIAKENLPFVFDKFYREDSARSATPGMGLGLAIVLDIVHSYGGTINVTSDKGVYTEFNIVLPLHLIS